MRDLVLKRTWKKHYIGLAVPQSMVIEMDNTIWQSFMKMQSEWNGISNRLSIGIDLLHCKTMIWQSRNAKNLELHCNCSSQHNEQFVNFPFAERIMGALPYSFRCTARSVISRGSKNLPRTKGAWTPARNNETDL